MGAEKPAFQVYSYDFARLVALLSAESRATTDRVMAKLHSLYFQEYFDHLGAMTIVVEHNYVDRDFLEDFAEYYVKCFDGYQRFCTRLHFFSRPVSRRLLTDSLSKPPAASTLRRLRESYLGFVVVKPLPSTIIGRTCLTTYADSDERHFPTRRQYDVSLFGIPLAVQSLAFQEQDTETAACATSALWSLFQGTSVLFHHDVPSPVEITKLATRNQPLTSRALPNADGLTAFSMAEAIRSVGLEPLTLKADSLDVLKANVAAYAAAGLPMILTLDLVEVDATGYEVCRGDRHAVTVTGYRVGDALAPLGASGFTLTASGLTRLYVHDDQIGPFARMVFDGRKVILPRPTEIYPSGEADSLATSWRADRGVEVRAIPDLLILPLYRKMRISLAPVVQCSGVLDGLISQAAGSLPVANPIARWRLELRRGTELKAHILAAATIEPRERRQLLTTPMPRYVWSAAAEDGAGAPLFTVFLDSTDLAQGQMVVGVARQSDFARVSLPPVARHVLGAGLRWTDAEQSRLALEYLAR